ncbi:MAG: hypothetical protein P8Y07_03455 [Gemmatimonadales bacterium]
MFRFRTIGSALALTLMCSSAVLGQGRLELTPMVGVSTAGGVDIDTEVSNNESFSVGSGFTWGGTLGNYLSDYVQFEVMVSPFFLVGAGAAIFTPDNRDLPDDVDPLDSTTRFQWGIGGGLKVFVSSHVGFRFQGRYKPTNVGTQPELWCGIWTCAVVDATQYLNSGEFLGGVIIRL